MCLNCMFHKVKGGKIIFYSRHTMSWSSSMAAGATVLAFLAGTSIIISSSSSSAGFLFNPLSSPEEPFLAVPLPFSKK